MNEGTNLKSINPLVSYSRPLSGMKKAVANRMCESYFSMPVVTLMTEIDMSRCVDFRKSWNSVPNNEKLSYLDMIIYSVAFALHNHPTINSQLIDKNINYFDITNIGFAVDLSGKGLLVPVIKNADKKNLSEVISARERLVKKALSGEIELEDISEGTFTVTNLGAYDIDCFTPIINYPESAILGVGRIVEKPVVVNKEIVIRSRMSLSLTHDHRVNDGAPAALFLKEVGARLENPEWMEE